MAKGKQRTPEGRRRPSAGGDARRGARGGKRTTPGSPLLQLRFAGDNLELSSTDVERAANLLKDSPLFRKLSRRLLIDVATRSLAGRLRDTGAHFLEAFVNEEVPKKALAGATTPGQILAIVVLKGTLIAAPKPADPSQRRPPLPSPLPPDPSGPLKYATELAPGVHSRSVGNLAHIELGNLRLEPAKGQEVDLLVVSTGIVAAPGVAWGIDVQAIYDNRLAITVSAERRPELIWMAAPSGSTVPAEALMHVLAGKIAQDYPTEKAALVTLGNSPEVLRWKNNRFEDCKDTLPKSLITQDDLFALVDGKDQRGRVFVLNLPDMMNRPTRLDNNLLFDRAVYLADEIPPALPKEVADLLDKRVTTPNLDGAYFSSFIPSISPSFVTLKTGAKTRKFKAGPVCRKKAGGDTPEDELTLAFMRCVRDTCVLPVDVDLLTETWEDWQAGGGPTQPNPFHAVAVGSGAISASITGSWGRAVTNRRVGVACSGGGASAYRIGPVLKRINDAGIPVDVFAGLSGGALVGSFYSRAGMDGFDFARRLGPFFQLTMPLVLLWTQPFEWVIDLFLERARVEDLGIRFAAVAAALPETDPPSATVVVHGTLGEAVRVSGSLPPSFAPSDKNGVRYTDGGAGTAVPAQVARDCGADVVLACNVIPGPARGNPFSGLPLGWLIRKTPILGRLVDNYTWYAFFMAQTSREFGASADVFVEFKEQNFPFIESSAFIAANWIIQEAEKEGADLDKRVEDLRKKWQALP